MSIEIIIGGIVTLIAAVAAAFGLGHSKGKNTAEDAATEKETQTRIEAERAVAKRQTETAKEAADVKDDVNRLSDSAVDNRLREKWRVPPE